MKGVKIIFKISKRGIMIQWFLSLIGIFFNAYFFIQVILYCGPALEEKLTFGPPAAKSLRTEYGSLECSIEVVSGVEQAIEHIAQFGSGHTDVIVTENSKYFIKFLQNWKKKEGNKRKLRLRAI